MGVQTHASQSKTERLITVMERLETTCAALRSDMQKLSMEVVQLTAQVQKSNADALDRI